MVSDGEQSWSTSERIKAASLSKSVTSATSTSLRLSTLLRSASLTAWGPEICFSRFWLALLLRAVPTPTASILRALALDAVGFLDRPVEGDLGLRSRRVGAEPDVRGRSMVALVARLVEVVRRRVTVGDVDHESRRDSGGSGGLGRLAQGRVPVGVLVAAAAVVDLERSVAELPEVDVRGAWRPGVVVAVDRAAERAAGTEGVVVDHRARRQLLGQRGELGHPHARVGVGQRVEEGLGGVAHLVHGVRALDGTRRVEDESDREAALLLDLWVGHRSHRPLGRRHPGPDHDGEGRDEQEHETRCDVADTHPLNMSGSARRGKARRWAGFSAERHVGSIARLSRWLD